MFTIKNEDVVSADLLSVEEVETIPRYVLANGEWWWLLSPGCYSCNVADVDGYGVLYYAGDEVDYDGIGVRPALTIMNLLNIEIGSFVEVFDTIAQYIGNDKVLVCKSIFDSRFDKNNNNYRTSEVNHKLDEWLAQMKGEEK